MHNNKRRLDRGNSASLLVLMLVALLTWVGMVLISDRGLYVDDYSYKQYSINVANNTWAPTLQPIMKIRQLGNLLVQNLVLGLPDYEFAVRLWNWLLHFANVALLGCLTYKISRDKTVASIAMLLFCSPVWAGEATLWFIVPSLHILGTLLCQLSLLLFIHAIQNPQHAVGMICLGSTFAALSLQFSEIAYLCLYCVWPVTITYLRHHTLTQQRIDAIKHIAIITFMLTLIGLLQYLLFIRPFLVSNTGRGDLVSSFSGFQSNVQQYVSRLYWLTLSPDLGIPFSTELFQLGLFALRQRLMIGLIMVTLIFIVGYLWIRNSTKIEVPRINLASHNESSTQGLVFMGVCWICLALLPGILLTQQILEQRMLYAPLLGASIVVAAVFRGTDSHIRRFLPKFTVKFRVAAYTLVLLFSLITSIAMLGYSLAYKLRYDQDMREVAALQKAVPPSSLESNTTFLVLPPDIQITKSTGGPYRQIDRMFYGGMEIDWSALSILKMTYKRHDISVITAHHWQPPMVFRTLPMVNPSESSLIVNGRMVALNKVIAYSFKDDILTLHPELILVDSTGGIIQRVALPETKKYSTNGSSFSEIRVKAAIN